MKINVLKLDNAVKEYKKIITKRLSYAFTKKKLIEYIWLNYQTYKFIMRKWRIGDNSYNILSKKLRKEWINIDF